MDESGRPAEPGEQVSERRLPTAEDFPATGPYSLAAPGPRFSARAIDLLLVAVVSGAVYAAWFVATDAQTGSATVLPEPFWLGPVVLLVGAAYETLAVAWRQKTLGKRLMGLRVVRYADGQPPTPEQALLRGLVPWAVFIIPWGVFLDSAMALGVYATGLGGELHRGVPDQAGGTIVISTR